MDNEREFFKVEKEWEEIEKRVMCGNTVVVAVVTERNAYPHPDAEQVKKYRSWFRDRLGNTGEFSETYCCPVCGGKLEVGDVGPYNTRSGGVVYHPFANHL